MQRKKGAENYLRIDRGYDISDEDEICACGCELDKIGENVTGKLDIVLTKIRVICHIRLKYACKNCEGQKDETPVKIAPLPPQITPRAYP